MDVQSERPAYDLNRAGTVFSRIGFELIAYLLAANLLALLFAYVYWLLFPEHTYGATAAALISMCTLNGCALPVMRLCLGKLPASAPVRGKARASTMLVLGAIAFAFLYGGNLVGAYVSSLLQSILPLPLTENTLAIVGALPWYVALPVAGIAAPLAEEYVFRKLILDRTRVYGEKFAILFSAILFAFFHSSVQQFFYALPIGLLLGYLYLRTGSLWRCFTIHALLNLFGSVIPLALMEYCSYEALLDAALSGAPEAVAAVAESDPVGFFCVLAFGLVEMLLVLCGAILFFFYRKRLHFYPAELDLPRDTEASVSFARPGVILYIAFCVGMPILLALLQG